MRVRTSVAGVLMLASAVTLAQTSVDRSFKSTTNDCSGVQWSKQAVATYPTIASACQGIQVRDGKTYVKFEGTVERNIDRGKQLEVRFKDGGVMKVTPPENMSLYVNDKKTQVSELSRGDELNFYIAEDRLAAQFAQDSTPTPQYVAAPIVYRETTVYRTAALLPSTASNSALTVLFGSVLTAFGLLLTIFRKNVGR